MDRAGRNHQALLYRRREADVALERCRIIVQKPSGGGKLDEDDGIVQFALKIVAAVILCLAEVYDRSPITCYSARRNVGSIHARSQEYPWLARNRRVKSNP